MDSQKIICVEVGGLEPEINGATLPNTINNFSFSDIHIEKVNAPDFNLMVPEEETAVDFMDEAFDKLREAGYFSPVRGMANIKNVLNDSLFAKIYTDGKGMRYIDFCQRYTSGEYSPIMRLPQADMRMAARYKFLSKQIEDAPIRGRVSRFLLDACDEYNGKFSGEDEECYNVVDILNVLFHSIPKLPIDRAGNSELRAEEFYALIKQHVEDVEAFKLFSHESYYMLDETGIVKLAHVMGMKKTEMLDQMKRHGFLYLTKSSKGYQTNARFKSEDGGSFTEWVYCIYKLEFFAGIKEKAKEDTPLEF